MKSGLVCTTVYRSVVALTNKLCASGPLVSLRCRSESNAIAVRNFASSLCAGVSKNGLRIFLAVSVRPRSSKALALISLNSESLGYFSLASALSLSTVRSFLSCANLLIAFKCSSRDPFNSDKGSSLGATCVNACRAK